MPPVPSPRRARTAATLLAGALATGAAATGAGWTGAAHAVEVDPDPLEVRIDALGPASLSPDTDTVRVRGTVTNRSDEEWTSLNFHVFTGASPITTTADLELASVSDPAEYVGDRIVAPGTFDTIATLAPGESAGFRMRVPREQLLIPESSGVYWLGVHAIGDSSEPRDEIADGKARTFVPQLPTPTEETSDRTGGGGNESDESGGSADTGTGTSTEAPTPVPTAVVVPMRAPVTYEPDGSLAEVEAWTRSLSPGGRLHRLLELDDLAGERSLTWLVDPAVPHAVARLAAGNPTRSLAPPSDSLVPGDRGTSPGEEEQPPDGADEGGVDDTGDGGGETEPTDEPTTEAEPPTEEELAASEAAQAWLERFGDALSDEDVLALPYGDLDVAAAARHAPDTYATALERSAAVMESLEITARPALDPPDGTLPPVALDLTPGDVLVLASDAALATPVTGDTGVVDVAGHAALVTSSGASAGGPPPGDPFDALALRQRGLAEAALHQLAAPDEPAPLVTVLPDRWRPADPEAFFADTVPAWIDPVTVDELAGVGPSGEPTELTYDAEDVEEELAASAFMAAEDVRKPARVLDGILTEGGTVVEQVTDEALTTVSYADRTSSDLALSRALAIQSTLESQLDQVAVEAPSSVTLSSTSGRLGASVTNGLDHPVSVRLDAITDGDLSLAQQDGPIEVEPRSRTRLNLEITTTRLGVHDVRLVLTDRDGQPLGSEVALPVRAAQVSQVIWVIMAIGGGVLFSAIAVRLVRRIRGTRTRVAQETGTA